MFRGIALFLLTFSPAQADDFVQLSGSEITEALSGTRLQYPSAWQEFRASGRTLYNAGSDSWGYWQVQGDRYCSQWSPRSEWVCYDVARSGDVIRFIGAGDDVSDGFFVE